MLPISYLLRNLLRRRVRTVVTIGGIAVTTLLVIAMTSFAGGMQRAAVGNERHDVIYLLGSSAEVDLVRSVVTRGAKADLHPIRYVHRCSKNAGYRPRYLQPVLSEAHVDACAR